MDGNVGVSPSLVLRSQRSGLLASGVDLVEAAVSIVAGDEIVASQSKGSATGLMHAVTSDEGSRGELGGDTLSTAGHDGLPAVGGRIDFSPKQLSSVFVLAQLGRRDGGGRDEVDINGRLPFTWSWSIEKEC